MNLLTNPLANCFGNGAPGWLTRDVPAGTMIDFREGRTNSLAGTFVRSAATGAWAKVG